MSIIKKMLGQLDLSSLRFKKSRKSKQKASLLKNVIESPEKFKLEALIEDDEIKITIRRREDDIERGI